MPTTDAPRALPRSLYASGLAARLALACAASGLVWLAIAWALFA